eukprot:8419637-Pyramimonas_sp.AAC.1
MGAPKADHIPKLTSLFSTQGSVSSSRCWATMFKPYLWSRTSDSSTLRASLFSTRKGKFISSSHVLLGILSLQKQCTTSSPSASQCNAAHSRSCVGPVCFGVQSALMNFIGYEMRCQK